MPDFETRRPPGTKRPSRAHVFEVAFRGDVSALGGRLNISKRSIAILLLAVLAVILIFWAVPTPAEQLDNEIQLETPPAYRNVTEELSYDSDGVTGHYCSSEVVDDCYRVFTEPTSAVKLASITKEVLALEDSLGFGYSSYKAVSVEFDTEDSLGIPEDSIGTSYCFVRKDEAVSTLGEDLGKAELLGTIDDCYIAVYTTPRTDWP
jgi:hypothetical protein